MRRSNTTTGAETETEVEQEENATANVQQGDERRDHTEDGSETDNADDTRANVGEVSGTGNEAGTSANRSGMDGVRLSFGRTRTGRYDRQSALVRIPSLEIPPKVGIIGLGNIGSHAALTLARVGVQVFNLYDRDKIELHNLASQSYNQNDLGKYKVHKVRDQILAINPEAAVYTHGNATTSRPHWVSDNEYLIVAVDTMETRKRIANVLYAYGNTYTRNIKRVIDIRVGGEQIDVFSAGKFQHRRTIRTNPDREPCGAQFVAWVSTMAGALAAKETVNAIHYDMENTTQRAVYSYAIDVKNMQIVRGI